LQPHHQIGQLHIAISTLQSHIKLFMKTTEKGRRKKLEMKSLKAMKQG
jgi:hypothetical protein